MPLRFSASSRAQWIQVSSMITSAVGGNRTSRAPQLMLTKLLNQRRCAKSGGPLCSLRGKLSLKQNEAKVCDISTLIDWQRDIGIVHAYRKSTMAVAGYHPRQIVHTNAQSTSERTSKLRSASLGLSYDSNGETWPESSRWAAALRATSLSRDEL